jgi:hypothetical protein
MPGPIVVIGSINMNLVCRTPRIPPPGETIMEGARSDHIGILRRDATGDSA